MITPHNVTLIHHILVYACGNASVLPSGVSDCYGADPDFALCSQVLVGWAVGGGVSLSDLLHDSFLAVKAEALSSHKFIMAFNSGVLPPGESSPTRHCSSLLNP